MELGPLGKPFPRASLSLCILRFWFVKFTGQKSRAALGGESGLVFCYPRLVAPRIGFRVWGLG